VAQAAAAAGSGEVLSAAQHKQLGQLCAGYLGFRLDAALLEAILRLTLRVSRLNQNALAFVHAGGLEAVLGLRQSAMIQNSTVSLISLILRHVIDDEATLVHAMCSQLRGWLANGATCPIVEVLQSHAHLESRNPALFSKACQQTLQICDLAPEERSVARFANLTCCRLSCCRLSCCRCRCSCCRFSCCRSASFS
jgi:hypothetical protein